jgi:NTE family protein
MRVALVLGGGGVIGLAYHAAALAAIEHDLGWDPRSADVVVGTSAGSFLGLPRLPSAALIAAWAQRPWRLDPIAALASVLPDGSLDLAEHATAIERVLGAEWPNDDPWLCTVRQNDLRRVVIGRDVWAPLSTAVCASCAIPGYFRPVDIGGRPHILAGLNNRTRPACPGPRRPAA